MAKVKIILSNRSSVKTEKDIKALIKKVSAATLDYENFSENAEVSVSFVEPDEIRELNRDFRETDRETDVLSFPLGFNGVYDENPENGYKLLGDIVISLKKAAEQATEYGHSLEREIAFLTVHSMLHLLGYDHMEKDEETEMRKKQTEILKKMGINRE